MRWARRPSGIPLSWRGRYRQANPFAEAEPGIKRLIERMLEHENRELYAAASSLLEKYYGEDESSDEECYSASAPLDSVGYFSPDCSRGGAGTPCSDPWLAAPAPPASSLASSPAEDNGAGAFSLAWHVARARGGDSAQGMQLPVPLRLTLAPRGPWAWPDQHTAEVTSMESE